MEQRAEGRGNCYMSEKKEKSLEFWLFVDEETYGANEIYRLLLSLVRLLIYSKVSFFFPVDIISRVVGKMLSWCLVF